jgi:predicted PurR-regulated permease PerM
MNLPSVKSMLLNQPTTQPETSEAAAAWSVRQMIAAAFTVLGVTLIFLILYRFYMEVFLFFVAFSLTVALDPIVTWLHRRGVRKELGVILIYIVLALAIAALIALLTPLLVAQVRGVIADLPTYYAALRDYLLASHLGLVRGVARALPAELSLPALTAPSTGEATDPASLTWIYGPVLIRTLFAVIGIFIMAFYWTLEGEVIIRKLVMQASVDRRDELRALIAEVIGKIGAYVRGQLTLCAIVGGLSLLSFLLLGIPNALVLGLLMGIFEAIPVIGPTLGAVPAVLMTLATAPEKTLLVIAALVGVQVLENNLLVPRVMDQSVGVNAVVSMLAIAAFGGLFGIAGAILAIPLAAILQIMLNRLLFEAPVEEEVPNGTAAASEVGRSRLDVLRMEARELAQAIRKQSRTADAEPADQQDEQTSDEIEAIAVSLDHYLATAEKRP